MSLLLLFAGAGIPTPPTPITKVIGRAGGSDAGRGSTTSGATHARLSSGETVRGDLSSGEAAGDATGNSAARGGVTSGEEP